MREKIIKLFREYCSYEKCNGLCCKKAEFTVFTWELKDIPLEKKFLKIRNNWGPNGKSKDIRIERISMQGRCNFLGENGCVIKINDRPLDCISYPVFPMIKYGRDEKKEIFGMMVHKSCPFSKKISKDKNLLKMMKSFWEKEIKRINNKDLKDWFGNKRNYWLDKNIIKIKI